ncbi:MAG: hypothetical protein AB9856_04555 [Cellulosilyticaceae bacterium]
MTQEQTKKDFHQDIINLYKRIRKEVKYTPPQLLEMINKYGGYEAVIKYIVTDSNIFLFSLLWENERLDLSLEALVIREKYLETFPEDIIKYCDKRLKEYNYAPKKIEVQDPVMDAFLDDFFEGIDQQAFINLEFAHNQPSNNNHDCYFRQNTITVEQWLMMLKDEKIFSIKNLDLVVRMYLMGGYNIPTDVLAIEEGYSKSYPYKEVITTLAKRIKAFLKIDMPQNRAGKIIPWHLLFTGWFEDSKTFELGLQDKLKEAIQVLVEQGYTSVVGITVKTTVEPLQLEKTITIEEHETSKVEVLDTEVEEVAVATTPKIELPTSKGEVPTLEETKLGKVVCQQEENKADKIESLKDACIRYYGAVCDVCGFDYGYTYGEEFEHLITVYPLKDGYVLPKDAIYEMEDIDPQKDLIPLCSNCHKVLTEGQEITVDKLKKIVK